ncbi:hypothetical protein GCM10010911_32350 [Paenibacillus nasutitermitis]|uniref:Uncharacterized protein n=1 Tax=Paenibacillus nasutitermitis TaxID=1652958 RepID=A0A916Z3I6_9BACL|nr:hypothetical protein GCM10010911_32350 [Paenibacillus nasutitermitis]
MRHDLSPFKKKLTFTCRITIVCAKQRNKQPNKTNKSRSLAEKLKWDGVKNEQNRAFL